MKNSRSFKSIIKVFTYLCIMITLSSIAYPFILKSYVINKLKQDMDISMNSAASIGIIGAADGPTSILVTSQNTYFITVLFAILSLVGVIYLLRKK